MAESALQSNSGLTFASDEKTKRVLHEQSRTVHEAGTGYGILKGAPFPTILSRAVCVTSLALRLAAKDYWPIWILPIPIIAYSNENHDRGKTRRLAVAVCGVVYER